jgi:sigma-B regulation protein RsbU (phosphoserine phosphatase)
MQVIIHRTSIALGLFDDIEVEERELTLQAGDWMLMYTDGVTEAFSPDERMFGVERLLQILVDHQFHSSIELVKKIEQSVNEFIQGADLSDDMTLTAIYRKPE